MICGAAVFEPGMAFRIGTNLTLQHDRPPTVIRAQFPPVLPSAC